MSLLLHCGICCFLISIWGIIQLAFPLFILITFSDIILILFMGLFYYIEAIVLLEDVEAEEYEDYDDFIKKTQNNFRAAALNCWIAAGIYVAALGLSYSCILKAKNYDIMRAVKLEDDEVACTPNEDRTSKDPAL